MSNTQEETRKLKWSEIPEQGLKELEVGDIFVNVKDKGRSQWVVRGAAIFNPRHGSPTRMCSNMQGDQRSKSCRIVVKKVGVSKFAEQYKLKPINKL